MFYSEETLKREIEVLFLRGQLKGNDQTDSFFVWEANNTCKGPKQFANIVAYCWKVYDKAFRGSTGRQIIGRTGDVWTGRLLLKYGLVDPAIVDQRARAIAEEARLSTDRTRTHYHDLAPRKELQPSQLKTLKDADTAGNIQIMDKWSPVVNDAWVLGGVHRRAEFELLSVQAPGNLWDHLNGFHVVTARELLGLRRFGYQGERQKSGQMIFRSVDAKAAEGATFTEYMTMMNEAQRSGPQSVTALISEVVPGLNEEIRSFDRTRLRRAQ